jgi:hypothetical protein
MMQDWTDRLSIASAILGKPAAKLYPFRVKSRTPLQ